MWFDSTESPKYNIINKNMERKKIYIAGKITGLSIAECYENFHTARVMLDFYCYEIVSPIHHCKIGMAYEECMEICLQLLEECDGIYMMINWEDSNGAKRELSRAKELQEKNPDFIIIYENICSYK